MKMKKLSVMMLAIMLITGMLPCSVFQVGCALGAEALTESPEGTAPTDPAGGDPVSGEGNTNVQEGVTPTAYDTSAPSQDADVSAAGEKPSQDTNVNVSAAGDHPSQNSNVNVSVTGDNPSQSASVSATGENVPQDVNTTVQQEDNAENGKEETPSIGQSATDGEEAAGDVTVAVEVENDMLQEDTKDLAVDGPVAEDGKTLYTVTVVGGKADPTSAAAGDTVTITANDPAPGWFFKYWESSDVLLEQSSGDQFTTSFTMPSNSVTVTATCGEILINGNEGINGEEYTGSSIEPEFTVELKGVDGIDVPQNEELVKDVDYTVTYTDNVNVGTAKALVTLIKKVGSIEVPFEITPASLEGAKITVANQVYNGTELKPVPTVTWKDMQVSEEDFTLSYSNNVHVGTAAVTVTGTHNFKDENQLSETFEISKRPVTFTGKSETRTYTGSRIEISTVTAEGLVDGHTHNVVFTAGETNAGGPYEGKMTAKADVVIKSGDADVTADYDVTVTNGALTIAPASAIITVANASKTEGETDPTFTGTVEGLIAQGDLGVISYKRTNSDEAPGTYKGVITAAYTPSTNYDVTVKNGDFTIKAKGKGVYKAVSGSGDTYTQGSGGTLSFTFKRTTDDTTTFGHFSGVEVDGKAVPERDSSGKANWTAQKGSVIVTLQPSYLETLRAGGHTLTAYFDDGNDVSVKFNVKAKGADQPDTEAGTTTGTATGAPKTGDETATGIWAMLLAFSAMLAVLLMFVRRRRSLEE